MRIQIDFPPEKVKELKALMSKGEMKTYNEVFDNALTLMKWTIQEAEKGRAIGSLDERDDRFKELAMPFLEIAASKRRSGSSPVLAPA